MVLPRADFFLNHKSGCSQSVLKNTLDQKEDLEDVKLVSIVYKPTSV